MRHQDGDNGARCLIPDLAAGANTSGRVTSPAAEDKVIIKKNKHQNEEQLNPFTF